MWIFCPSTGQDWTVADISVCQLQMSRHIIVTSSVMQHHRYNTNIKFSWQWSSTEFKSCSRGVMVTAGYTIAWPGVAEYDDTPCVLLSRSLRLFTVHQGPVYAGHWGCNWTLWPPISEYHRDHDRLSSTRRSPAFSVWCDYDLDEVIAVIRTETKWSQWQGLGDTNTNNDNSHTCPEA